MLLTKYFLLVFPLSWSVRQHFLAYLNVPSVLWTIEYLKKQNSNFPFFYTYNEDSAFFPSQMDWVYLLILSLVCTTLAFVLNLRALKHISAFTAALIGNLEVLYGIILAILICRDLQT